MIIKHCFTALVDDLGLMIVTKIEIYKITLIDLYHSGSLLFVSRVLYTIINYHNYPLLASSWTVVWETLLTPHHRDTDHDSAQQR